ncbi:hypothetical protein [Acidisphaera sp. S103]|uniref:hypothetical protein n=1 Tax=Acidisphaera sp. S103 TaxID=1747223 RepID=UPI00131C42E5|nr:hypothetical protein [Acidisphaera sp. S103]
MKPTSDALQILWPTVADGNPAIHFTPMSWNAVRTIAERQGVPSPQELVTRLIGDLIQVNSKGRPSDAASIRLEWVTYGMDPNRSPEALLVFHSPTCATIAGLWKLSEDKAHDFMAGLIQRSLEAAGTELHPATVG